MWGSGGDAQRGWGTFELTGQGCEWVRNWDEAVEELESIEYEVRRCDLAVDTYRGEVSHQRVVEAHEAGLFSCGGRPPDLERIETWPREKGWTAYVGVRSSAKFFRGYEKGFEQLRGFDRVADRAMWFEREGERVEPSEWYRCEVELKAKHRALPEDLIVKRDHYFGGAYPFCRALVDADPFQLTMSRERRPQLELSQTLGEIQRQWGRSLFTALVAFEGDMSAVWERIVGDEHSEALVGAGVLLVEH
jgi:DNA relaxase NicK